MNDDYQNLPYETLSQMSHGGDFNAYKELVRRHTVNQAGNQVQDNSGPIEQANENLDQNPDVRKPHMWAAFMLWMLWQKITILAEPAGICVLLYVMYRLAHDTYYEMRDFGTASEKAVTYATSLIIFVVLGKVTNMWMRYAWARRPLTIWLVIAAVIFWVDGISFI